MSNNSCRVIALTTNTCAFMWTKLANRGLHAGRSSPLTSRAASHRPEAPLSWAPFWYLLWPHPSLFSQYDIWPCCVHRSKNCTLFLIKMSLGVVFFHMTKKKKLPKCIESAKTLDAKSVRRPPPPHLHPNRSPPVFVFFLILWITRSVSYSWSFLICYLTVWACVSVRVWVGGAGELRMLVPERLFIYVAIYLNKVHFLHSQPVCSYFALERWRVKCRTHCTDTLSFVPTDH